MLRLFVWKLGLMVSGPPRFGVRDPNYEHMGVTSAAGHVSATPHSGRHDMFLAAQVGSHHIDTHVIPPRSHNHWLAVKEYQVTIIQKPSYLLYIQNVVT